MRAIGRDHPRMRGEDIIITRPPRASQGSPPHARGRRRLERRLPPRMGITPACAGKTSPSFSWPPPSRDHPRMRGED